MNIGIDARPLTYQLTGIGVYLKHVLDEIQKIDHLNRYVLISNGPIVYELLNPKWIKIEGRLRKKLLSTLWMQLNAPIICIKYRLNLFWGSRHHLPILLPPKMAAVVTIHDIVHRLYPETMALPNLWVERLLMKRSLKRADAIMADSYATATDLKNEMGIRADKIETIHLGTPRLLPENEAGQAKKDQCPLNYFLFVGSLDPRKNFERIFSAFSRLNPLDRGLHLVIVGATGWKNGGFLEMLRGHPLRRHIRMPGYVSPRQLVSYYRNAICLLFPSLYEGFGLPILEAMHYGAPVITSNASSMKEVAGDSALLVNPHDTGDIAAAMNRLFLDGQLRKNLTASGFARAKEFSWKKCAEKTVRMLNKTFEKSH